MTKERIEAIRRLSSELRDSYNVAEATGMMALVPVTYQDVFEIITYLDLYASLLDDLAVEKKI